MSNKHYRIILQHDEKLYKLLDFDLNEFDGSFYMFFPRCGISEKSWTGIVGADLKQYDFNEDNKKVSKGAGLSYHASGFIHYKNLNAKNIYMEPTSHITQQNMIIVCILPTLEKLDKIENTRTNDFIISVSDPLPDRLEVGCIIAPIDYHMLDFSGVKITYAPWFDLCVCFSQSHLIVPQELSEAVHYLTPARGIYDKTTLTRPEAQIHFHQKRTGAQEIMVYPPNSTGEYTMIFIVPMRIPPQIDIDFMNPDFVADITQRFLCAVEPHKNSPPVVADLKWRIPLLNCA